MKTFQQLSIIVRLFFQAVADIQLFIGENIGVNKDVNLSLNMDIIRLWICMNTTM